MMFSFKSAKSCRDDSHNVNKDKGKYKLISDFIFKWQQNGDSSRRQAYNQDNRPNK